MLSELKNQLSALAYERSKPFCYQCYHDCPSGRCESCGSDDLMRSLDGVGCEYGTDWIIQLSLETELSPMDIEEDFEALVRDSYPEETTVGWMRFDTVQLMKENDPVSWRCALSEHESNLEADEQIVSFDGGSTYYRIQDIEELLT